MCSVSLLHIFQGKLSFTRGVLFNWKVSWQFGWFSIERRELFTCLTQGCPGRTDWLGSEHPSRREKRGEREFVVQSLVVEVEIHRGEFAHGTIEGFHFSIGIFGWFLRHSRSHRPLDAFQLRKTIHLWQVLLFFLLYLCLHISLFFLNKGWLRSLFTVDTAFLNIKLNSDSNCFDKQVYILTQFRCLLYLPFYRLCLSRQTIYFCVTISRYVKYIRR